MNVKTVKNTVKKMVEVEVEECQYVLTLSKSEAIKLNCILGRVSGGNLHTVSKLTNEIYYSLPNKRTSTDIKEEINAEIFPKNEEFYQ